MIRTAILIDGGFYRRRAQSVWGEKNPEEGADELITGKSKRDPHLSRVSFCLSKSDKMPIQYFTGLIRRN